MTKVPRFFYQNCIPETYLILLWISSVVEKPNLKIPGAVVKALPGQYLWCLASGTPPVHVRIMKSGDVLSNSTGYVLVRVYYEGTYRCVASNEAGMDYKDIQVTLATCKFIYIAIHPLSLPTDSQRFIRDKILIRYIVFKRLWCHIHSSQ